MPLFIPTIAPFTMEDSDVTVLTSTAITAGKAFFTSYVLTAPLTITQMRVIFSGAPTGNVDMGIYDATGANDAPNTLLGHTGAILSATGVFTQNLTANLSLSPGRYWLAFLDTVADSVGLRGSLAANIGVNMQTSAAGLTVLPSTSGAVVNGVNRIGIIALRSGGWS